jgi:hypothetical protein
MSQRQGCAAARPPPRPRRRCRHLWAPPASPDRGVDAAPHAFDARRSRAYARQLRELMYHRQPPRSRGPGHRRGGLDAAFSASRLVWPDVLMTETILPISRERHPAGDLAPPHPPCGCGSCHRRPARAARLRPSCRRRRVPVAAVAALSAMSRAPDATCCAERGRLVDGLRRRRAPLATSAIAESWSRSLTAERRTPAGRFRRPAAGTGDFLRGRAAWSAARRAGRAWPRAAVCAGAAGVLFSAPPYGKALLMSCRTSAGCTAGRRRSAGGGGRPGRYAHGDERVAQHVLLASR